MSPAQEAERWPWHKGGCHCGDVRFRVQAPLALDALECSCSMCAKVGFLHWITPRSRFVLESGEDVLTTYQCNTGTARHLFCRRCGVKSFYIPRSNPDGYSVNLRCLDPMEGRSLHITPFDGQRWEQSAADLAELSSED